MRVVGVVVAALVLAALAGAVFRGVRRAAWPHDGIDDAGRSATRTVVEGLILLAALILGVVVVVALTQ